MFLDEETPADGTMAPASDDTATEGTEETHHEDAPEATPEA